MYDKVSSEYDENGIDHFISSVNSYFGLMKHYKSYKVRKRFILTHLEQWIPYISIGKGYQKIVRKKDFTV